MKLAYERPVMHAEQFRVNSFVAACGDPDLVSGRSSITLGSGEGADTGTWYDVPAGWSNNFYSSGEYNGDTSSYNGLTFTKKSDQWSESHKQWQYYWTATSGTDTYYLEYSYGWSTKSEGKDVFVLYKEDGDSTTYDPDGEYYKNNPDELTINWDWSGSNETGTWSGLPFISDWITTNNFDTLIAGIIFDAKIIQKS